jgi:hypothetical protein
VRVRSFENVLDLTHRLRPYRTAWGVVSSEREGIPIVALAMRTFKFPRGCIARDVLLSNPGSDIVEKCVESGLSNAWGKNAWCHVNVEQVSIERGPSSSVRSVFIAFRIIKSPSADRNGNLMRLCPPGTAAGLWSIQPIEWHPFGAELGRAAAAVELPGGGSACEREASR